MPDTEHGISVVPSVARGPLRSPRQNLNALTGPALSQAMITLCASQATKATTIAEAMARLHAQRPRQSRQRDSGQ